MAKHRNPLPTAEERQERRRQSRSKKLLKISAVLGAAILAIGLFWLYCTFFGNPITAISATSGIRAHVASQYPTLELDVSGVKYDRSTKSFYATATSKTSEDTHFNIYFKSGQCTDYYDDSVKNLFNTIERFEKAYSKTASDVLLQAGFDADVYLSVSDFDSARSSGEFYVDMPVTARISTGFSVYAELKGDATLEKLSDTLKILQSALSNRDGLPEIEYYNLKLTHGDSFAECCNVTSQDVQSQELSDILQNALDHPFDAFEDLNNEYPLTVSVS